VNVSIKLSFESNWPSLERYTPNWSGVAAVGAWFTWYSIVTLFESVVVADSIWMAGVEVLGSHRGSSVSTVSNEGKAARRRAVRPTHRPRSRSVKLGFTEIDVGIVSSLLRIEIAPTLKTVAALKAS
jgi:hypothetical protein